MMGRLQHQISLEMRRDHCEPSHAREIRNIIREPSLQRSPSLEDDVEVPNSPCEDGFPSSRRPGLACNSDEEIDSADEADNIPPKVSTTHSTKLSHKDDYHCLWFPQEGQVSTWSAVSKETEELIHLNGNASFSPSYSSVSKTKRCSKVVKDRLKQKSSLHSNTHSEMPSKMTEILESLVTADQAIEEDPIADFLDDVDGKAEIREGIDYAESRAVQNGCSEHSTTETLDTLQAMSRVMKRRYRLSCRRKGRTPQLAHKRTVVALNDTDTDDELPGPIDSGSSSDDEPNYQNLATNFPDQKKHYVGDRFDEALKASSYSNDRFILASPKTSGCGLYGKLQQVMKREKEKEMTILKKLQSEAGQRDDSSSLNVRILSAHLEARLVVCKCSIIKNTEDSRVDVGNEMERTIIFSPRVCGNVDVEVGSTVRVFAPWKEVQVRGTHEAIILCSYFSPM